MLDVYLEDTKYVAKWFENLRGVHCTRNSQFRTYRICQDESFSTKNKFNLGMTAIEAVQIAKYINSQAISSCYERPRNLKIESLMQVLAIHGNSLTRKMGSIKVLNISWPALCIKDRACTRTQHDCRA